MSFVVMSIAAQIVVFLLVFLKLVTTNHWTIGKKVLVGLIGSLIWFYVLLFLSGITVKYVAFFLLAQLPILITTGFMSYIFYFKHN